jgi:hypothetical protein
MIHFPRSLPIKGYGDSESLRKRENRMFHFMSLHFQQLAGFGQATSKKLQTWTVISFAFRCKTRSEKGCMPERMMRT